MGQCLATDWTTVTLFSAGTETSFGHHDQSSNQMWDSSQPPLQMSRGSLPGTKGPEPPCPLYSTASTITIIENKIWNRYICATLSSIKRSLNTLTGQEIWIHSMGRRPTMCARSHRRLLNIEEEKKSHAKKKYGGVEVQLHVFLVPAPDGSEVSFTLQPHYPRGNSHWHTLVMRLGERQSRSGRNGGREEFLGPSLMATIIMSHSTSCERLLMPRGVCILFMNILIVGLHD
jgi:hypothetical protein